MLQGDYIWASQVNNAEFDIPIGGKIIAIETSRVKILDDDDKQMYVSKQQVLKLMHISSEKGVDDMINLGDLQEYAILRNLHKRYKEKKIYVSTLSSAKSYRKLFHFSKQSLTFDASTECPRFKPTKTRSLV